MIPPGETLPSILLHHAERDPDRTALVLVTGRQEAALSMRQLLQGAAAYAAAYRDSGVAAGEVIVDLMPPGKALIEAFLGGMLLGAVPSILPFATEKLDPARYRQSLAALMAVTHPAAIVAQHDLASELRRSLAPDPALKAILEGVDGAGKVDAMWEGLSSAPESLVLLQHSSGTTGLQKGVALSHRAVLRQLSAYAPAIRLSPDDVIVSWLPLYHDMGLIAGFLMPLLVGVKLVLLSPFEWVRAPWTLLQAISRHRGTLCWLPNFAYNFCAQRIPNREMAGADLSSWRAVINCSEPMYASSHRLFSERFTPYNLVPEALCTCYAMAENVFAVTQGGMEAPVRIDCVDAGVLQKEGVALPVGSPSTRVIEMVSAGPPLPNCQVRVVDDQGRDRGEREVGELALKSDCMLSGYYNRADATSASMRDGWFLTGDLGYLADGEVYISGRKKDLIIVGGKNIFPQDIEHIINHVPGVYPGRVVVFGIPNEEIGTEEIGAVAEFDPSQRVDPGPLGLNIRQAVAAESEVVLRYLHLVDERWLIKTSSGKIARAANRDKFLQEIAKEEQGHNRGEPKADLREKREG